MNPADNTEEFGLFGAEDIEFFEEKKKWLEQRKEYGAILAIPGTALGDIALVPAPFLKQPKGVRDVAEWYMTTAARPDYVRRVFERQCEVGLQNLGTLIEIFGDLVQVAVVTGTDFGTQRGPFIKPAAYRDLFKPYHLRVNEMIHRRTRWKSFIHSCGSVYDFLPDFIEVERSGLPGVFTSSVTEEPAGPRMRSLALSPSSSRTGLPSITKILSCARKPAFSAGEPSITSKITI